VLAITLSNGRVRAIGLNEGFETYALGALDSTWAGGPNEGTNGGANPWFGAAAPNIRVVNAENGVTPHSGTNMIRGCYNCLYDNDVDWFNLSFRCATGGVFMGNFAMEWWFYDPLGSLGGGDYVDYIALCNYAPVTPDKDYEDSAWPAINSQRLSLGSYALRFDTAIDATVYQARIVGATDGANGNGWFNLTNAPRSAGWHHARIVIGVPNGADTIASFYIDDMITPRLTHGTVNADGFNLLEVDGDVGNTSGYFDDLVFKDNVIPPTFAGPTNATVFAGGTAVFAVNGSAGTPSPSFYWQKNGVTLTNGGNINGANGPSLSIANCSAADQASYSCLASNIAGVAVGTAALTVIIPPTIDSQTPAGGAFSAGAGGTVNLSVTAHATHAITYQWNKNSNPVSNGGHVSGAATATLTLTGIDATDAATYFCHLSNADGNTNSATVTLSLATGPTIAAQPTNQTVALGSNATFVVSAAGAGLHYQWRKGAVALNDGGRISGATSSALTISAVVDPDNGTSYSCVVTNTGGQTNSAAATLTVVDPPLITTQPSNQVATNGVTVAFHVIASGTSPAYRWKKNGSALADGGDYSGTGTPDLSVHVTTSADLGIYTVTVSNLAGSVTSSGAALRINQTATNFFDNFETYSITNPIGYGRINGTALDYNHGENTAATDPWWGPSPPNFCTFVSGQDGVTAYSGSQMAGSAYGFVTTGDNDESFLNLSYRFNGGQLYYGDIVLDWYFYDPGTADYGDQLSLANFGSRMPANSDSTGFQIPATPIQNLFIGAWQNLDTTKYQAAVFGAADGTAGRFSKNISGNTKYFDTTAVRSAGWHHARILVGPADPGTHIATVQFFVDDMSNTAFTHDLPAGSVGFNSLHLLGASVFAPATSETAGFFDDVNFQAANDPYIVQQPVSQTTNFGATVNFTVAGMATSYQWLKGGSPIAGATAARLTLNSVSSLDAATYTCVVSGANGSITSSPATLTVLGSPPVLTATLVGSKVVITWSGAYTLLSATNVTGPYSAVPGATSPYTNSAPLATRRFFGLGQ
jgi:hypothetical protein